jgi:hypothetical protein
MIQISGHSDYLRRGELVVESDGVVAVGVLVHGETVLAGTAVDNLSGDRGVRSTDALEVGSVPAVDLEGDGLEGAVVLAEEEVLEVDVLVGVDVWWALAVGWVGAVGSLGSGCGHGGGTEESGEGEELHGVWFGWFGRVVGVGR